MALVPGTLTVTLAYAEGLRNVQTLGKQDPYCTLTCGLTKRRSKTHNNGGVKPVWNEQFTFNLVNENELSIKILNSNLLTADGEIGTTTVSLAKVRELGSDAVASPVYTRTSQQHGFLHLQLSYRPTQSQQQGPPFGMQHNYQPPAYTPPPNYNQPAQPNLYSPLPPSYQPPMQPQRPVTGGHPRYPNLTSDDVETLTLFFQCIDNDRDGQVTISEMQAACGVDYNRDGVITYDEAVKGGNPWMAMLAQQDRNKDSKISLDELLQFNNDTKGRTLSGNPPQTPPGQQPGGGQQMPPQYPAPHPGAQMPQPGTYQQPPSGGPYSQPPPAGFPQQPPGSGYGATPYGGAYPPQAPPGGARPQGPPAGYPSQTPGGYPNQANPTQPSYYPQQTPGGYGAPPGGGYAPQPAGYPSQPQPAPYPQQHQPAPYAQQPGMGGYPGQPQAGGYQPYRGPQGPSQGPPPGYPRH